MASWTPPISPPPGPGWPSTCRRRRPGAGRCSNDPTGTETWVKHENHNPTGAFKVRGGVNFCARLVASGGTGGLISASRGNHSQSLAFAGSRYGVPVTIVVPEGNSPDKNAATEAYGAELVIHGRDFQESLEHAGRLAEERGLTPVPPFHPWLVEGVATYAAELHEAVPDLDVVYVPVGMGSGICANIAVRDLLGLATEIVGVVAERAPAYALSFEAGEAGVHPDVGHVRRRRRLPHAGRRGGGADRGGRRPDRAGQRGAGRGGDGADVPVAPTTCPSPPGRWRWPRCSPSAIRSRASGSP